MRRECVTRRLVVDQLRRTPGASCSSLGAVLGIPERTVRLHMQRLLKLGVARKAISLRDTRRIMYFLNEKRLSAIVQEAEVPIHA